MLITLSVLLLAVDVATSFDTLCAHGNHMVPQIFGIGPAKTGTTSLAFGMYDAFCPETLVFGKPLRRYDEPSWFWKEKHYFNSDFVDYYGNMDRYLEHYPQCDSRRRRVAADFTPQMGSRRAAERIRDTYGPVLSTTLRFVVTTRDPIERVASEFKFYMEHFPKSKSRRFKLWHDFNAYVDRRPNILAEHPEWKVHFRTRDEQLGYKDDPKSLLTSFDRWIASQLALAVSCHLEDHIPMHRLWPDCGEKGIFRSLYGSMFNHWTQYFDPKQFIILPISSYAQRTGDVMDVLRVSLGLDTPHVSPTDNVLSPAIRKRRPTKAHHSNAGGGADLVRNITDAKKNNSLMEILSLFYAKDETSFASRVASSGAVVIDQGLERAEATDSNTNQTALWNRIESFLSVSEDNT